MKHQTLREVAKFGAGLVLGDFLALWWVMTHHLPPYNFIGMTLSEHSVSAAMVFDAALFLILIHYGWHLGKIPALREKAYLMIAGTIFGIVGVIHLWRLFVEGNLIVGSWSAPVWLSWIGAFIALYLSYMSCRLASHLKK